MNQRQLNMFKSFPKGKNRGNTFPGIGGFQKPGSIPRDICGVKGCSSIIEPNLAPRRSLTSPVKGSQGTPDVKV